MAETKANGGALRIGIVGAGLMGSWHAHAAARLGARIIGIVDPDRERAAALAGRQAGMRPLESLAALLDEPALDVVHMCTPLAIHVEQITQVLERRVHVLAEKPLAGSADEPRQLLELAAGRGVLLCPVHQMVVQRGIERAATVLPRLGELCQISFVICSAGGAGQDGAALDAIVGEILPHPLSLLTHLWPEEPLRPQAGR